MTTNFLEHLDSALIRPGRADVVQYIGNASEYQTYEMFLKFYPQSDQKAREFANAMRVCTGEVSMAALQGHFLRYKDDPYGAMSGIQDLLVSKNTNSDHDSQAASVESDSPSVIEDENDELLVDVEHMRITKGRRGPLTVDQVDRMVFNPQADWENDHFFTGEETTGRK